MGHPCSIIPQIQNKNLEWVESKLFKDMLEKTGKRDKTKQFYEYVHSDEFMKKFGDWINYKQPNTDENGEPLVDEVLKKYVFDDGIADVEVYYAPEEANETEDTLKNTGEDKINEDEETYKFQEVIDQKKRMRNQLIQAHDYALKNDMYLKAEQISRRIGNINNEINELTSSDERPKAIEDIKSHARKDFQILQQMFKKEEVAKEELQFAESIINLWSNMRTTMLSDEELENDYILSEVDKIENTFNNFHNETLRPAYRESLESETEQKVGTNILEGVFHDKTNRLAVKDIDFPTMESRNISKNGRLIGDALAIVKQDAHQRSRDEYNSQVELLLKLHEAKEEYKKETGLSDSDLFDQLDKDGNVTSNNVARFSQKWFDKKRNAKRKWMKANSETMDPRMLIEDSQVDDGDLPEKYMYHSTYTQEMVDKKISKLKSILGDKGYNELIEDQRKKLDNYKKRRQAKYTALKQLGNLSNFDLDVEMTEWVKENSPYAAMEMRDNPSSKRKPDGSLYKPKGEAAVNNIPYRYKKNGEETGFYDKKFERIENDSRLLEYYDFYTKMVDNYSKFLTPSQRKNFRPNSLPFIERTFIEKMRENGMSNAISDVWSWYQDGIKAGKSFKATKKDRALSAPVENKEKLIQQIIQDKKSTKRAQKGELDNGDQERFRIEAEKEIAQQQQSDRTEVLRAYMASLISFKHSSRLETFFGIAENVIEDGMEITEAGEGVKIGDYSSDPKMEEGGLDRLKKQANFFVNNYYGMSDVPAGVSDTKVQRNEDTGELENVPNKFYNREEKRRYNELSQKKSDLEAQIKRVRERMKNGEINAGTGAGQVKDLKSSIKDVENEIDGLGDYPSGSGKAKKVLTYLQLKTMGYNFLSAFATIGFGVINNYTEAGDGRSFGQREITEAYGLVLNSVLKNSTLNAYETEMAEKIRNLMDTFNFSATETSEISSDGTNISRQKETGWKSLLKRFLPYKAQQHAEYIAQAPIMIARMKRLKTTDAQGNERDLFEAFDKNGNWKTEEFGENTYYAGNYDNPEHNKGRSYLKTNIDALIEKNHGDYNGELPVKFSEDIFKASLMQFRKWIIEAFAGRWEARKTHSRLGYEVKGRFRTGMFGIGYSFDSEKSVIEQTVFSMKQLLRKVTFQGTRYDEVYDEVDAANMRQNLNELLLYLAMSAVGILISGFGDDDEPNSGLQNYMLNWAHRVESDILMYINPNRTVDILKNPVAGFSILEDFTKFGEASIDLMTGQSTVIETGQYEGESVWVREALGLIPGAAEVPKLDDLTRLQRQAQN